VNVVLLGLVRKQVASQYPVRTSGLGQKMLSLNVAAVGTCWRRGRTEHVKTCLENLKYWMFHS